MRNALGIGIVAASLAVSACSHREDAGATVSRNYQVGAFDQVEVAGPYDVQVRTGPNVSVSASGSEKLLGRTIVEVKGNKLVIRPEQQGMFHFGWSSRGKAAFTVTVPALSGATIAGSGDIKVDQVKGASFEGTVAGSGGIDVGTMDVQQLKLTIAGSGGARAGSGKAQNAKLEIAGSGDIDAGRIAAQTANVSIAGSGNIKANATGTADVSIMGSGDVEVTGGAKCTVSKQGSGNVSCS
jgi:hypothetical protein